MKFSKLWLTELLKIEIESSLLAERLTMAGLEIASMQKTAPNFFGVVIGSVIETIRHPDADKLSICQVNIGEEKPLNIVCGASNVRAGLKVAVAKVGAELSNNFKIKPAKLRGVESCGMLCSFSELGLPEKNSGIIELDPDAPIGANLREYLDLDDEIFELELTPNRGDCLSVMGIAREVAALNNLQIPPITLPQIKQANDTTFPVNVSAASACPCYMGRTIRLVNNNLPTPTWMKRRLESAGLHSINLIVDISNYVMIELGQPLHAFDLAKLDKKIEVRYAQDGESITLLDGSQLALNKTSLIIADDSKPLALAGVMGGLNSSISTSTTEIFLESAHFDRKQIAIQSQQYNLKTDSSMRFERGVDYKLPTLALDRATALIIELSGGEPSLATEVTSAKHLPAEVILDLKDNTVKNILGIDIPHDKIGDILRGLGMTIHEIPAGWQVSVPSFRFDISIKEDLVEEVARIYGYNHIPEQKITVELMPTVDEDLTNHHDAIRRIYSLLNDLGYNEAITYSFSDQLLQRAFVFEQALLPLVNPIATDLDVMRRSLWPGLVKALQHNLQRNQLRVRLFEIGLQFIPVESGEIKQQLVLSGVATGGVYPEQWSKERKNDIDFFDLKNDLQAICSLFVNPDKIKCDNSNDSSLHPNQSAEIFISNAKIGKFGQIHPLILKNLDIDQKIFAFEIDLNSLINKLSIKFKPYSRFPGITRDIAIIVDKDILWSKIKDKIVDISGELLHNVVPFDIYSNENIGLDKHSIAIHLRFQSLERTLVDKEVDDLVNKMVLVLKQCFGADLRG